MIRGGSISKRLTAKTTRLKFGGDVVYAGKLATDVVLLFCKERSGLELPPGLGGGGGPPMPTETVLLTLLAPATLQTRSTWPCCVPFRSVDWYRGQRDIFGGCWGLTFVFVSLAAGGVSGGGWKPRTIFFFDFFVNRPVGPRGGGGVGGVGFFYYIFAAPPGVVGGLGVRHFPLAAASVVGGPG